MHDGECKTCGKKFRRYLKRGKLIYCSRGCYKPKQEFIDLACEYCKKPVVIPRYRKARFRFCSYSCRTRAIKIDQQKIKRNYGENHPLYKGGYINKAGYKKICVEGRQLYEHRYIMEQHLGRKLLSSEEIHHIDGNKTNNVIANFEILSKADHARRHLHKAG